MKLVEANCLCPDTEVLDEVRRVFRGGGHDAVECVRGPHNYAPALDEEAVARVFRAKGRRPDKPLPLLLAEAHHALLVGEPDERFWRLALRFWPGPLTIVVRAKPGVPESLAPQGYVGVRLPNCPLAREIARIAGGVVTGTSANKSGRESPRTVYDASAQLGDQVDLYIDGGPALLGKPSTVVLLGEEGVEILREGAVPAEKVMEALRG